MVARRAVYHTLNVITISLGSDPLLNFFFFFFFKSVMNCERIDHTLFMRSILVAVCELASTTNEATYERLCDGSVVEYFPFRKWPYSIELRNASSLLASCGIELPKGISNFTALSSGNWVDWHIVHRQ